MGDLSAFLSLPGFDVLDWHDDGKFIAVSVKSKAPKPTSCRKCMSLFSVNRMKRHDALTSSPA